jgi:hypothetical protein
MPREAAMHGCCLITGILGSAGNSVDLPIPQNYKLDSSETDFLGRFKTLATEVMRDFDKHYQVFNDYRVWLKNEPKIFKQQIADYFC